MSRVDREYKGPIEKKTLIVGKYGLSVEQVAKTSYEDFQKLMEKLPEKGKDECRKVRTNERNRVVRAKERKFKRLSYAAMLEKVRKSQQKLDNKDKEIADAKIQLEIEKMELNSLYNEAMALFKLNPNTHTIIRNENGDLVGAPKLENGNEPEGSILKYK